MGDIVKVVMMTCGLPAKDAEREIRASLRDARENFAADGNLELAVNDVLSSLGLDMDYEEWVACRICGV